MARAFGTVGLACTTKCEKWEGRQSVRITSKEFENVNTFSNRTDYENMVVSQDDHTLYLFHYRCERKDIVLCDTNLYLYSEKALNFSGPLGGEILASFPGSPGMRIYIARRAWYLSYVSMTSAK